MEVCTYIQIHTYVVTHIVINVYIYIDIHVYMHVYTQNTHWKVNTFCYHWQAPKKLKNTKPLDAPNLHRHKKKANPHFPTPIQKWAYSCWKICFFFGACRCVRHFHFVCFVFFGAFAGLVTLTSQNIGKHQKNKKHQTTRNTKPAQAQKNKKSSNYPEVGP